MVKEMSAKLYNPKSGKFVNVDAKQLPTLRKAGWLSPEDKKVKPLQEKFEKEAKAKAEAELKKAAE